MGEKEGLSLLLLFCLFFLLPSFLPLPPLLSRADACLPWLRVCLLYLPAHPSQAMCRVCTHGAKGGIASSIALGGAVVSKCAAFFSTCMQPTSNLHPFPSHRAVPW